MTRFVAGSWADCTRRGEVVFVRGLQVVVATVRREGAELALDEHPLPKDAPVGLLFVRGDRDNDGRLLVAAKGSDDSCRWWTEARGWLDAGPTHGNYCVEVEPRQSGWVLYIQRDSFRYEVLTIGGDGAILARSWAFFPDKEQGTAQGFLDAPARLFTDQSTVGHTIKPVSCGPFLVGQDGGTPLNRVVLSDIAGNPLRVLATTDTESPRAAWLDGRLVMASIAGHQTVIAEGAPEDFPLYTVPQPPPKPDPQPEPEPIVSIPDYLEIVQATAAQYPTEFAEAHHPELGDERAYAFIKRLAAILFAKDRRIGLCWKRGLGPLGWDSLTVLDGTATQPGSRVVAVIDVIGGAGGPNPTPTWGSVEIAGATWVRPDAVEPGPDPQKPPPVVTPPPPKVKSREQFAAEFRAVNDFYGSQDGLQRPGGMVLDGGCDVVAMIQWGYDLMTGSKVEDVITAIRGSHEWKVKHGAVA